MAFGEISLNFHPSVTRTPEFLEILIGYQAQILLLTILKVLISNLFSETGCPNWGVHVFLVPLYAGTGIVP
jgi:hypothetical protein